MLCYRDRAFCDSDCVNRDCSRFVSDEVRRGAALYELPLALAKLAPACKAYQAPRTPSAA